MPVDRGGQWPEGGWFLVFTRSLLPFLSQLCLSFAVTLACILCLSYLPLLPASLALPSFLSYFAASLACLAWTGPLRGPSRHYLN
jgi:hypothetical protein